MDQSATGEKIIALLLDLFLDLILKNDVNLMTSQVYLIFSSKIVPKQTHTHTHTHTHTIKVFEYWTIVICYFKKSFVLFETA